MTKTTQEIIEVFDDLNKNYDEDFTFVKTNFIKSGTVLSPKEQKKLLWSAIECEILFNVLFPPE